MKLKPIKLNVIRDSTFSDIENDLITFFANNPNPTDDKVHAFSKKKNIDSHNLEGIIYRILSSLIHLKGSDKQDSDFDPNELKIGLDIEQEHHEHDMIAKNIAKAHLEEIPDYYTRLVKMEKEAGE